MFTGDPGGAGKGLTDGRMMVPRGKMLGGSSGLNYMAYVRGHPGDFDGWAADGGKGWSLRRRAALLREERGPRAARPARGRRHRRGGPRHRRPARGLGALAAHRRRRAVRRRPPSRPASRWATTTAATAAGPTGLASLFQTTTRDGKRSSTFHAFLEPALERPNLTVITHALVERVLLEVDGAGPRATGIRYRDRRRRDPRDPRRARGRRQRRRDRLAAAAAALGHRPQRRARRGRGRVRASTTPTSASTSRTTCTCRWPSRPPASR